MNEERLYKLLLELANHPITFGFGAGVVRFLIGDKHAGWKALVTSITISMFVAGAATLYLSDEPYSQGKKAFFTVVASLLARDILIALLSIGAELRKDPWGFPKRLREALKGQGTIK